MSLSPAVAKEGEKVTRCKGRSGRAQFGGETLRSARCLGAQGGSFSPCVLGRRNGSGGRPSTGTRGQQPRPRGRPMGALAAQPTRQLRLNSVNSDVLMRAAVSAIMNRNPENLMPMLVANGADAIGPAGGDDEGPLENQRQLHHERDRDALAGGYLRLGSTVVGMTRGALVERLREVQVLGGVRVQAVLNRVGVRVMFVFHYFVEAGVARGEAGERVRVALERVLGGRVFFMRARERAEVVPQALVGDRIDVLSWNVNTLAGKLAEVRTAVETQKPVVFCLQETMFSTDRSALRWAGYSVATMDPNRAAGGGRGLVVGVRKCSGLVVNRIWPEKQYCLVTELCGIRRGAQDGAAQRQTVRVGVVNVYVNPRHDRRRPALAEIAATVRALGRRGLDELIVAGDFNMTPQQLQSWLARSGTRLQRVTIHGPTRFAGGGAGVRRTAIDHILTRGHPDRQGRRNVGWRFSDHIPIVASVRVAKAVPPPVTERIRPEDWAKSEDSFEEDAHWLETEVSEATVGSYISTGVWKMARASGRVAVSKQQQGVFLSRRLRDAFKAHHILCKNHYAALAELGEEEGDVGAGPDAETDAQKAARLAAEELIALRRRELRERLKEERKARLVERNEKQSEALRLHDARTVWRQVQRELPQGMGSTSSIAIKLADGTLETDPLRVLDLAAAHFQNLARDETGNSRDAGVWEGRFGPARAPHHPECDDGVTVEDVAAAVKKLMNGKSPGLDGVPNEALKCAKFTKDPDTGEEFVSPFLQRLHEVVSRVWDSGKIPRDWEDAAVVAIPKKGDLTDLNNYRGISLMNTTLKLISTILAQRLELISDRYGIVPDEQVGFRSRQEALMQTGALLEVLERRKAANLDTHIAFIDFEKAYDRVPHQGLLAKLRTQGFGGKLLALVEGMYENPKFCVRVGGRVSESRPFLRGVRQGDPASPMLFNLYISDILEGLSGVPVPGLGANERLRGLLYADDTVIFAESRAELQRSLARLRQWCMRSEMKINAAKCGLMMVSGKDNPAARGVNRRAMEIGRVGVIPYTPSYVYLGTPVYETLPAAALAENFRKRGLKAFARIKGFVSNRTRLPQEKIWVIRSILGPSCMYGAELCATSAERVAPIHSLLVRAARLAVNGLRDVDGDALLWALRIKPPLLQARLAMVRACHKWSETGHWIRKLWPTVKASARGTALGRVRYWVSKRAKVNEDEVESVTRERLERSHFGLAVAKLQVPTPANLAERIGKAAESPAAKLHALSVQVTASIPDVVLHMPEIKTSLRALLRLAHGRILSTAQLVHMGKLDPQFGGRCPSCRAADDTPEHYLWSCPAFGALRDQFLGNSGRELEGLRQKFEDLNAGQRQAGVDLGAHWVLVKVALACGGHFIEDRLDSRWMRPLHVSEDVFLGVGRARLRVEHVRLRQTALYVNATQPLRWASIRRLQEGNRPVQVQPPVNDPDEEEDPRRIAAAGLGVGGD